MVKNTDQSEAGYSLLPQCSHQSEEEEGVPDQQP